MRFMDTEMDAAEMEAFAQELAEYPELRKQLDFEQSVRDKLLLGNSSPLPGIASIPNNSLIEEGQGKIRSLRKWFAFGAAAVIAIFLVAVVWKEPKVTTIVNVSNSDTDQVQPQTISTPITITEPEPVKGSNQSVDMSELFKRYFKKDDLPEEYPLFLAEALLDYETGQYKTLLQLDLSNPPQTRGASEADKTNILQLGHYYKGLAFLQTGNTKEAIANLNKAIQNKPDKSLLTKTQWYLLLAYLKENNRKKAAELCNSIIKKENHTLVKEAKEILSVLEK